MARSPRSKNTSISKRAIPREASRNLLLPLNGNSSLTQQFGVSITTSSSISQRFGVTVLLINDGFEYVDLWPDAIPDSLINQTLNFNTAETSLFDNFETADSWP